MTTSIRYVCDCNCGAEKKSTNHWWLITPRADDLKIRPWDVSEAKVEGVKMAAGRECCQKIVERWLESTSQVGGK